MESILETLVTMIADVRQCSRRGQVGTRKGISLSLIKAHEGGCPTLYGENKHRTEDKVDPGSRKFFPLSSSQAIIQRQPEVFLEGTINVSIAIQETVTATVLDVGNCDQPTHWSFIEAFSPVPSYVIHRSSDNRLGFILRRFGIIARP